MWPFKKQPESEPGADQEPGGDRHCVGHRFGNCTHFEHCADCTPLEKTLRGSFYARRLLWLKPPR